jgi:hypothetical protein
MEQLVYNLVPLVRRARDRRSGLASDRVHHQPRPAASGRGRGQIPGSGAQPCAGPAAAESRGLVVAARLTQATGVAERAAASMLIEDVPGRHRITVGADRAYDTAGFVAGLRRLNATPHVAQNVSGRSSRIDRRTVRHPGYLASQLLVLGPRLGSTWSPAEGRALSWDGHARGVGLPHRRVAPIQP